GIALRGIALRGIAEQGRIDPTERGLEVRVQRVERVEGEVELEQIASSDGVELLVSQHDGLVVRDCGGGVSRLAGGGGHRAGESEKSCSDEGALHGFLSFLRSQSTGPEVTKTPHDSGEGNRCLAVGRAMETAREGLAAAQGSPCPCALRRAEVSQAERA